MGERIIFNKTQCFCDDQLFQKFYQVEFCLVKCREEEDKEIGSTNKHEDKEMDIVNTLMKVKDGNKNKFI